VGWSIQKKMLIILLFLFVGLPILELVILLYLASITSVATTLLLVVVTGVIGASLARWQGWNTYVRIQRELAAGHMPTESLLDAAMIFVAGAVLLTPGVLTDIFGFSLLIPICRRFYRRAAASWIRSRFQLHTLGSHEQGPRDEIIETTARDVTSDESPEAER
jgi:UPF0716 protein FxsA